MSHNRSEEGSGDSCRDTLEFTYHHYRQLFEDRSRLTWQEETRIRHPELREYIKYLYSNFWGHVDTITRLYFKMLELQKKRIDMENSIHKIWARYASSPNELKKYSSFVSDFRDNEKTTSSEMERNGRTMNEVVKWYRTRVVRYKTASEFATELRLSILIAVQGANSVHATLPLSPVFSLLETKLQWFTKQVQNLENDIHQLDMSRHLLQVELNTANNPSVDGCLSLAVKKTKPKERKEMKTIKRLNN